MSGEHDVGCGLVLGPNLFNLAGLLGLSALLIGQIEQARPGLLLHGTVALITTLAVVGLVLGWLSPMLTLALVLLVFAATVHAALSLGRVWHVPPWCSASAKAGPIRYLPRCSCWGGAVVVALYLVFVFVRFNL